MKQKNKKRDVAKELQLGYMKLLTEQNNNKKIKKSRSTCNTFKV